MEIETNFMVSSPRGLISPRGPITSSLSPLRTMPSPPLKSTTKNYNQSDQIANTTTIMLATTSSPSFNSNSIEQCEQAGNSNERSNNYNKLETPIINNANSKSENNNKTTISPTISHCDLSSDLSSCSDLSENDDESDSDSCHMTTEEELAYSKKSLAQAKSTISSLIEQISDYQTMVEEEKEREKEQFQLQLEEMMEELDELKKEKNNLAKTNIKNLETLMHEIDQIEETNIGLRETIETEKKRYQSAVDTIQQLKEELANSMSGEMPNLGSTLSIPRNVSSQVMLEFKVDDGVVSKVKLVQAKVKDDSNPKEGIGLSLSSSGIPTSVIDMEEERNELLKKLLFEKENHGKTLTALREEKLKSESNKTSVDELVKKIKELIKLHSSTLKELDEERELSQQRADQINDLRLQISRPTTTTQKLQRTHSQFITMKRTPPMNGSRSNSICSTATEIPQLSPSSSISNGSSKDAAKKLTQLISSLPCPAPPDSMKQTTPPSNSSDRVSPVTASNISSLTSGISTTTPPPATTTPLSNSMDENLLSKDIMFRENTTLRCESSAELRALRRSAASFDLNASSKRMVKVNSLLGHNENMISWLNNDPTPAPIQCMAEVGKHVWVGCSDGSIRVMDKDMHTTVATRPGHSPHGVYTLVVVGKTVWSSSRDSKIKVWSAKSGKLLKELDGHSSHVTSLLLVGQNIWSISADMAIRVWSISSYRCIKKIETKSYLVSMAKFNNQIWIGTESSILRWDSTTFEQIDTLQGHKKMVHCMIPVDNYIWSCSSDNLVCLWDPNTGKLVKRLTDHKSRVFYLLRVNNHVWSCAWDRTIKIHHVETLELVKEIEPVHRDALSCLTLIKKANTLTSQIWSGSWDHTIIIWKTSDPTPNSAALNSFNTFSGAHTTLDSQASSSSSGVSSNPTPVPSRKSSSSSNNLTNSSSSNNNNNNNNSSSASNQPSNNTKSEKSTKRGSVRLSMFFGNRDVNATTSTPNLTSGSAIPTPSSSSTSHLPIVVPTPIVSTQPPITSPKMSTSPRSGIFSLLSPRSQSVATLEKLASPPSRAFSLSDFEKPSGALIPHDLIKVNQNHSVMCNICQTKITSAWGKKQVNMSSPIQRLSVINKHLTENNNMSELEINNVGANGEADKKKEDFQNFLDILPILTKEILKDLPSMDIPAQQQQWISRLIDSSVAGGKMNRGLTVVHSLQLLVEGRQLTRSEVFQANVLGWCVEWLQAFFLVADDIMDQSITRRGQPCWYRTRNMLSSEPNATVGSIAINDAFILESCIYILVKKYFRNESYYADLLDLFHETSYQTELGQLLDLTTQPNRGDFSMYSLDTYRRIVKYKTAYYSFYLPVALAMLMAGITSKPAFDTAKDILLPMGEYFQVQDDYLDCYGDPKVIGKIGRDIEENKCTWLVCQAVLNANPEQIVHLKKVYGREAPADVAAVKKIYAEIGIERIFKKYEDESHQMLVEKIKNVKIMPQEVFYKLLSKIYKRNV
ncbi:hypothetical protein PPL_01081 [Heterostelium album PN500]|uniref:(2E,6E)-farnesyl diphosphate synthase n=1 Tax=Heterostelium pallidum (strain ATCC 26659 / Pp 5 / PN500) TaxID=670386 RepID=D3AY22_HETP5|nr:hypothetical protein PPL_01081 [Heterostelium album PN500]EFA85849.1 hypothetical protein PPL_01081 [Heterostelium album PN500]|eukprot:XP_020437955.1 hypothetical protein PPL_01081 [Heterostelium album PN500]